MIEKEREEVFEAWKESNKDELEIDFLENEITEEEQPVDDEIGSVIDIKYDEFKEFCRKEFEQIQQ